MSECSFLTPARLAGVLAGAITAEDRAALRAHLAGPCEACLDTLASLEDDAFLTQLAGDAAELRPREVERMWAAVDPAGEDFRLRRWWASVTTAFSGRALAFAVALAVIVGVPVATWQTQAPEWTGVKSVTPSPAIEVALDAFAGEPQQLRRYEEGSTLQPEEVLFFRYRLSARAWLTLLAPPSTEPLWSSERPLSGEGEIAAAGQALGLPAKSLSGSTTLLLVASPQPLEASALEKTPPCAGCAVTSLRVEVAR